MSENLSQVTHRLATKESIESLITALEAASGANTEAVALVQEAIEELPNATQEAADNANEAAEEARQAAAMSVAWKQTLTNTDNLDTILASGIYYLYSVSSGVPTHWPSATIGQLVVYSTAQQEGNTGGDGTVQTVTDYNGLVYIRYKRGSGWTDFRRIGMDDYASLTSADDLNNYTRTGQYVIGNAESLPSHYPSTNTGRLVVFGDEIYNTNRIVQMVVDYQGNVYFRYISGSANPWFRIGTEERGSLTGANDLNNYTKNGQYTVNDATSLPDNYPSALTGRLIVFGDLNNSSNRIVQMVIDYRNTLYLRYKSAVWTKWTVMNNARVTQTITVKSSGGDYTKITDAVKYVMDNWSENPDIHYLIKIDPGTYDISDDVVTLIGTGMEAQGLWIPPNTTICGAGKDKTVIAFEYGGTNDDIMSNVSAFNMPYESEMMDLTIRVKNIRYCIHSALQAAGVGNKYIDDVTIRLENVKLIHLGFDDGKNPTYYSPGTFGSGNTNGGRKEFYNCDFIAKAYSPWFNHNRKNLTKGTEFIFEGCSFINELTAMGATGANASVNFITWADDPQNMVTFRHCSLNKFLNFTIRTDSYGTLDAHSGYYVSSDGDLIAVEPTTNYTNQDDNWFDSCCMKLTAADGITAYTPVSRNSLMTVRPYNSEDAEHGIALNTAASGEPCVAKLSGHIYLPMVTATSFAVGKKIGWNGTAWAEDNENPILEVVYPSIAKIV